MSPHICKNLDLTVFTANMAGGICRREMTQKQAKDTKEKGQMKNAPAVGTFPKHLLCTQLLRNYFKAFLDGLFISKVLLLT